MGAWGHMVRVGGPECTVGGMGLGGIVLVMGLESVSSGGHDPWLVWWWGGRYEGVFGRVALEGFGMWGRVWVQEIVWVKFSGRACIRIGGCGGGGCQGDALKVQ